MVKNDLTLLAAPLGVCIIVKAQINHANAQLRLFSESGVDDGAYYPSQDIGIYGDKQIEALRDFCNQVLEKRKEHIDAQGS